MENNNDFILNTYKFYQINIFLFVIFFHNIDQMFDIFLIIALKYINYIN